MVVGAENIVQTVHRRCGASTTKGDAFLRFLVTRSLCGFVEWVSVAETHHISSAPGWIRTVEWRQLGIRPLVQTH